MNRILQYLTPPCPCAAATETLAGIRIECERIEATCEGVAEFIVPSFTSYLDGRREIGMFLSVECDEAAIGDDLRAFTIQQLRTIARELESAASRLEVAL